MAGFFKLTRAIAARLMFSLHGLATIWRTYTVYQKWVYLMFLLIIFAIMLEGTFNVVYRKGNETRWLVCIYTILDEVLENT